MAQLLLPGQQVQLTGFDGPVGAGQAFGTAATLTGAAAQAQQTQRPGPARPGPRFPQRHPVGPGRGGPGPGQRPGRAGGRPVRRRVLRAVQHPRLHRAGPRGIDQADGGSANWNVGINYESVLATSPFHKGVQALYQAAGLNLSADLQNLTKHANITPDPAAVSSLEQTSVPTGHLSVPELDLHTIGDNLVPVTMENFYAKQVTEAGDRSLLRQAYTSTFGHCNFSPAELSRRVLALSHRVTTGSWDAVADPASLNRVAAGLNLGAARFAEDYSPGSLTGAIGANNAPPSQG